MTQNDVVAPNIQVWNNEPVNIFRDVIMSPLGVPCEFESCKKEAYIQCVGDKVPLCIEGLVKSAEFHACNKYYCLDHIEIRTMR